MIIIGSNDNQDLFIINTILPISAQSPENIQFFLGTAITFQKLPTFLAVHPSIYSLFQAKRVVHIVPEIAFLAFLYQIFGNIIQNVAFHKINIISSYFS